MNRLHALFYMPVVLLVLALADWARTTFGTMSHPLALAALLVTAVVGIGVAQICARKTINRINASFAEHPLEYDSETNQFLGMILLLATFFWSAIGLGLTALSVAILFFAPPLPPEEQSSLLIGGGTVWGVYLLGGYALYRLELWRAKGGMMSRKSATDNTPVKK
ncbi:MAG: hypothetical protein GC134_04825 [Proteobacteria bacterium]|nr:hypothetical protein [Pseudomonadota bacterium]